MGTRQHLKPPRKSDTRTLQGRLRIARREAGLERGEVAESIGLGPETIRSWETGRRVPRLRNLRLLAEMYGVELGWLLDGERATSRTPNP